MRRTRAIRSAIRRSLTHLPPMAWRSHAARSRSIATSCRSSPRVSGIADRRQRASMRAVLLRSLAVIGVGAVLLAGVLYVATTFDARPPSVLEVRLTAPVGDDERVAQITTSIEVAFS